MPTVTYVNVVKESVILTTINVMMKSASMDTWATSVQRNVNIILVWRVVDNLVNGAQNVFQDIITATIIVEVFVTVIARRARIAARVASHVNLDTQIYMKVVTVPTGAHRTVSRVHRKMCAVVVGRVITM